MYGNLIVSIIMIIPSYFLLNTVSTSYASNQKRPKSYNLFLDLSFHYAAASTSLCIIQ